MNNIPQLPAIPFAPLVDNQGRMNSAWANYHTQLNQTLAAILNNEGYSLPPQTNTNLGVLNNSKSIGNILFNSDTSQAQINNSGTYLPIQTSTNANSVIGTNVALGSAQNNTTILRSNSGTAMADTLPNANTLPNGFTFNIRNTDATATNTITPSGSSINGNSSLTLSANTSATIVIDGANYYTV